MRREDGTFRNYAEMKEEAWIPTIPVTMPIPPRSLTETGGEPFRLMYTIFLPEVAVDTETGKVKVEKFTSVADCGTILNKLAVDGLLWRTCSGYGLALSEDFEDIEAHLFRRLRHTL